MAQINLKSLLGKNKEATIVITNLVEAIGTPIGIEDTEGRLLLGEAGTNSKTKYPVRLEGEILGWVSGGEQAESIACLLTHLAGKEAEKKTLGNEVLGLYRETNLIYNFSEKLVASLEVSAIAGAALEQARQLIKASGGTVMLLNEETQVLETAATFGYGIHAPNGRKLGEGIVGAIAATGNAEIVNEVQSDSRHSKDGNAISSLLCAPFKIKEQVKGVIVLVSDMAVVYTAAELKLLIAIASQAALAVENALLHEKMVREATRKIEERRRELEIAVQERTAELAKQKENIELLSEIGKEITASLDMDTIFYKLYEHVNQLVDATIFGVGIFHPEKEQIEYRLAIEKGKRYAPYTRDMSDKNQFPVWCIENRQPVFINDVTQEYNRYVSAFRSANVAGTVLEDGTLPEEPLSIIYLPLVSQEKVLGVITIQSFQKNAYTEYHLNLLQNLAAYTSIALDNADAYRHLKATQQQLVTQEKLASLGQLTAGIAHEIKNPLNFVNNFAVLSMDLAKELKEELVKRKTENVNSDDFTDIEEILDMLVQNAEKINHHGKRADSIVKSMMQHARGSSGQREPAEINALLDDAVNLVYHGMRANDASFNVTIEKEYDETIGKFSVVPQDISRVFLNLINNACYAAHQKQKANRKEQTANTDDFSPTLSVGTKNSSDKIEIRIRDNGNGIPPDIREKIFNPFFTTKPTGQGTGLGLSISYDIIVQQHKGEIKIETEEGKFTEFVLSLPK
ncbi:GAF domain-containing protein [candidate division KSB1 bacterium]|nr:GAF domain-containing protein [candidate division KSB1 bacterium]